MPRMIRIWLKLCLAPVSPRMEWHPLNPLSAAHGAPGFGCFGHGQCRSFGRSPIGPAAIARWSPGRPRLWQFFGAAALARRARSRWPEPSDEERQALAKEPCLPLVDGCESFDRSSPHCFGGLTDTWAARAWDKEHLLHTFGSLTFRLRPCFTLHQYGFAGPSERLVTLAEYLLSDGESSSGCVLFENDFDAERLSMLDGFGVPDLLSSVRGAPIFSVGRKDTGIGFHRHSAAWLAQLQGRKLWLLVPGGRRPAARAPWQYLTHRPPGLLCCVAHPGEVVYVPAGWWHATWNLDDLSLGAGWEQGDSASWEPGMHAIMDGAAARLTQRVTLPALSLAARTGRLPIFELLLERGGRQLVARDASSAAIAAARSGHIKILAHLWSQGFPMMKASASGTTALHEAARCGRLDAVQWLLDHNADCTRMDSTGGEALHVAAAFGHVQVVETLLQATDSSRRDADGRTALMLSSLHGHVATTELLASPASVKLQDNKGRTALHFAAIRGQSCAMPCLLEARADVQSVDHMGRTPLHLATLLLKERDATLEKIALTWDAHLPAVQLLLDAGAEATCTDQMGYSPLDYAERHKGMLDLLAQK
ncbi:unnamed protein product [Effrenium voratum]|nr:unnamed protein product [Effrenium voratum]